MLCRRAGCLFVLIALLLTSCSADGFTQVALVTKGSHTQAAGELINGTLIILGGEMTLEPESELSGSIYMLAGRLTLQGWVGGDVSILGGQVVIDPQAEVGGDLNLGGGEVDLPAGAHLRGRVNTGTGLQIPELPAAPEQTTFGLILRWLLNSAVLAVLAYWLRHTRPHWLERVSEAAVRYPLVSVSMGALVGIVGISLLVLMAFTILLIPVSLIGLAFFGLAVVYGWIALASTLGQWLSHKVKGRVNHKLAAAIGTFLFMLVVNPVTQIPTVGGIAGVLVMLPGFGAVFLTRLGLRRFVPPVQSEPADASL